MIKFPVMTRFILLLTALSCSTIYIGSVQAAAAGKVVFTTGSAKAVNASGASRTLRRGDEVFSGDSLQTSARSRLQVAFADGAYISVQPSSEYKIENYNYPGKADGTERAFYRLLKGGIRAVTGYIGKRNRDAYKVNTMLKKKNLEFMLELKRFPYEIRDKQTPITGRRTFEFICKHEGS